MTSDNTFPRRFTKIDDLTRRDHSYLTGDDACCFIGEYTARKGYAYSATNQPILNFKKTMDRRGGRSGATRNRRFGRLRRFPTRLGFQRA